MERIAVIMGKMHSGGKKNLVMEYYRHIDRTKIQFDFICDEDSNAVPTEEIEALGGRVYIIPPYQRIFANMRAIRKICKMNHYRIAHAYNGTMNVFSLFAAWRGGVTIRINESISMAHSADKKTVIKQLLKPFSRCFATHYMANGEACGRWQFGDKLFDSGKVKVFKTIIDVNDNCFDLQLREKTRLELGIKDEFVVGHIGRLTVQKNTLFVIDVFCEILKMRSDTKLIVIGDGELRDEMLKRIELLEIEDNVIYLGRREDIKQFYNAMDCFLLPSLYEGLPVVGVEAECCGLPTFFSEEISRESSVCADLGFFIDLGKSAREWAKEIVEKSDNIQRKDRSEMIKNAGFDSNEEASKLCSFYLDL